ncbi:MAG: DUF2911 domain-containing protein [Acidobacteria bacterium]|nr:DUF2911 domain-containing protein [Acidobacteriota bacterium]MBV9623424.1 DUF2911 domain-containing protein [Acidobacteriota bacterium]
MKRSFRYAALVLAILLVNAINGLGQSAMLTLPDASQAARVGQRIGITDIAIDYHRPLVRGRKIFGRLQPYGTVWRAGANVNTTIAFSDPVTIEGQPLGKGVYGLHMIPGETSWVLIFSKDSTSWGSFSYNQAEDALRVSVKPQAIENQEALSYEFDDLRPNSAVIVMRWEKVAVPFKVEVNTPEIVQESLRKQLRGRVQFEWQPWMEAANYLLDNKLSAEEAAKYAEQSISIEDRFENEMTKAQALAALGRKEAAAATEARALGMGSQIQIHGFGRMLQSQGKQNEALELFRSNIKKDPNTWVAHNETARLAVARGDFDTAIREMKTAATLASGSIKTQHANLITLLENRVDINQ